MAKNRNGQLALCKPRIDSEKEKLDSLKVEIRTHVEKAKDFIEENTSHPESSRLVTWSIMAILVLFFTGVICPLGFLPLELSQEPQLSLLVSLDLLFSLRGVFLALVLWIFVAIMFIFLVINLRLKLRQEDLGKLERYTHYSTYSEYLANYFGEAIEEIE